MTKFNYERMYKELTQRIVHLKGTDNLGKTIEISNVVNLLNEVEDKEKEIAASESDNQTNPSGGNEKELKNRNESMRDFARKNRLIKE